MLKRTTILLTCAAGASSSLVVSSMKENLEPGENWVIDARSILELPNVVAKYDVIMVAPQVNYDLKRIRELAEPYGSIKVLSVNPSDYASADGKAINEMIRNMLNGNVKTERRIEKMSETKSSFMDKLQSFMEQHIVPIGMKIANQRHLSAVRDGLTILIPVTIIGGFAVLLAVPPIPATITEATNPFYAFLLAWKAFAGANAAIFMAPYYLTIGIIAVYVVIGVSYQLARSYKMNEINNAVAALLVYLCVSGAFDVATASINVSMLGAGYMFSAMLIACLVVEINRFFQEKNIVIKMPDSVPPNVAAPFNVLLPLIANVVLFMFIDKMLIKFTGAGLARLVYTIFQPLMRATGSLPSVLLINFLMTTFWFFGIHGANMLSVVTTPITTSALAANADAVVNGTKLPYIYAGAMNSVFGNWITYTAMLVIIFIFGRSNQAKSVAKVAIVPSCFNINEPSIFGLPTVLNVYTYIPMIICSFVNCSAYYLLAQANVVGRFYVTLPFTVPGPLQAFLATGDGKTIILWFILFAIDMVILYPFITTYDRQLLKQETEGNN